jgi:CBS domain-containing protein
MRVSPAVHAEDSLERAAYALREGGSPLVAVLHGNQVVGAVSEVSFANALARGCESDASVREAFVDPTPVARTYTTGADALRIFEQQGFAAVLVLDDYDHLLGFVTPSDLAPKPYRPPRPPLIGGMATPFGVYLTTGSIAAGASSLALVSTGMVLFTMITGAVIAPYVASLLPLLLVMAAMRAIPLSGIHAAEHKVVHAIERGEELTRENVRRMPRVHPRCGTNLATGVSLFLGLGTAEWLGQEEVRWVIALIATILFWRTLGGLVQYWVTTKEPTDKQLDMGIRSGKELLRKQARASSVLPNPLVRIWNSGMIHVIAGSTLLMLLLTLIGRVFGIEALKTVQ